MVNNNNKTKIDEIDSYERSSKRRKPNIVDFDLYNLDHAPIKGVRPDWSGARDLHASLRQKVIKGQGLKTVVVAASQTEKGSKRPLVLLLDSGADDDIIFLPDDEIDDYDPISLAHPNVWTTSNGQFQTDQVANLKFLLPEYSQSKIMSCTADIKRIRSKRSVQYDAIIGVKTLHAWGVTMHFKEKVLEIDGISRPMKEKDALKNEPILMNIYNEALEPQSTTEETARAVKILDAKYEAADLEKVVEENCPHLSRMQRLQLLNLLKKHEKMFQGKLGEWKGEEVHFDLKPGVKPFRGRPFPVPQIHKATLMKEINRLVDIGVLEQVEQADWLSPSFCIPKSDQTIRFLSDFRELNKALIRRPFPLPKVADMLQQMDGFTFATAIDLNMGYYHLKLDAETMKICAIVFPWGIYRYRRLPMGVACSPDIFQSKMSSLFAELEFVQAYIDDLLVISKGTFEDHLQKLDLVLQKLSDAGLQVNAVKSKFAAHEIDYLGYHLTKEGIAPQQSKVAAILALKPPRNVKDLRRCLGIIQYYRDLWVSRTQLLAPLTDLVGECGTTKRSTKKKPPWRWEQVHQDAFEEIKKVIARDVILAYPNFGEEFTIFTDASTRQLGGVITQNNRPIAFFSRKLNTAQQKYTVTELELLSIVELLKEFKGMLLGQKLVIYTDHQNLVRDSLGSTSDRVQRWNLLLNEYGADIRYIKGVDNTVADAISRLDYCPKINPHPEDELDSNGEFRSANVHSKWNKLISLFAHYQTDDDEECSFEVEDGESPISCFSHVDETPKSCFAHIFATSTADTDEIYPVTVREIADAQREDPKMNHIFERPGKDRRNQKMIIDDTVVLVRKNRESDRPRLIIPDSLQSKVLSWYHHYLQHPGSDRMEGTIGAVMYWHGMSAQIRRMCKFCPRCQKAKTRKRKYGHVPPKEATVVPWQTLHCDLIGPTTIKAKDGKEMDFMCLTMIDAATGWFEIVELPNRMVEKEDKSSKKKKKKGEKKLVEIIDKTSATVSHLLNKSWLCRYPRPKYLVCDNGSEFELHLKDLCKQYQIQRKPTTSKNPQANAIIERVHAVFNDMLRASGLDDSDTIDAHRIDQFIQDAAWAIRSTYHTVLKATPGEAIFGRDMLFDIPYIADWNEIGRRRQEQVDRNNARENDRRLPYDYVPGSKCLIINEINGEIQRKAKDKHEGPYVVTDVYTNGTVRIQRGSVNERINIRRLTPFFEAEEAENASTT